MLSITIAPLAPGTLVLFLFGAILLVGGMGLFTLGVEMSMTPMGEGMGGVLSQSRRTLVPVLVYFLLGVLSTVAEPDLQVLAEQVPSIDNLVLILTVAVGVGFFLVVATQRVKLGIPCGGCWCFSISSSLRWPFSRRTTSCRCPSTPAASPPGPSRCPSSWPWGWASPRPAATRTRPATASAWWPCAPSAPSWRCCCWASCTGRRRPLLPLPHARGGHHRQAAHYFWEALPDYFGEVALALLPIAGIFLVFQVISRWFKGNQLLRVGAGLIYTYLGLVLFLCGVNVGFMPAGQFIGATVAASREKWLLIPIGMLIGYYIVKAEPAVAVLTKQVEEVSNGAISHRAMGYALSIGVCASVGLAMVRVLTGIHIFWLLIPGYVLSLGLTFLVPPIFTGIAFDSGGVASGPMTATFLLPFAQGACQAVGGNMMTDAFGIVAMVAMTPLITIQVMGLSSQVRHHLARRRLRYHMERVQDVVVYFD